MSCITKITADIVNSCHPVKGIKKVWLGNRTEWTRTKTDNTVSIAKIGSVVLYIAEGFKDFANAGHDGKIFENLPTGYIHKLMLNLTVGSAAAQKNIDQAEDLIVFVLGNNGTIYAYGIDNGLYKTSQAQMANDNNGLQAVEYATREGMEEEYSVYFATQSEVQLDALTV